MQSLKRVRHVSDNTLYFSTYPRYFGDKHFDIFSRERLMRIIEGQENYLCNKKLLSIVWANAVMDEESVGFQYPGEQRVSFHA